MIRQTIRPLMLLLLAIGGTVAMLSGCPSSQEPHALDYRRFAPPRDYEQRLERLGSAADDKRFDLSAFEAMPADYSRAATDYVEGLCAALKAEPIKRRKFLHVPRGPRTNFTPYPDDANPTFDREVIVPLVILPRPEAVKAWAASTQGGSLGWRTPGDIAENRGSVYGRTLVYAPGKLSKNPKSLPPIPFEADFYSWDLYVEGPGDPTFFNQIGKLVLEPDFDLPHPTPVDRSAVLHLTEQGGAQLLAEFLTVPACLKNPRLRWTSITDAGGTRQFLAYAMFDGNGVKRAKSVQNQPAGPISPYVRPLTCQQHQPQIKQHDELLLPTPLGWPPRSSEWTSNDSAHEEWCLDDWFPAQPDACWVVREAEDSRPLQESFLLMPAREPSDRPAFFIALFAETEPQQLLKELAALYHVSPDEALQSKDTMTRLESLYQQTRNATASNR